MKLCALILSFLLSFLSEGREAAFTVSESQSTGCIADFTQNREICLTSAQGYTFAGSDSTNSISVRLTQSGKRISPQFRSAFRMVKGGKVIDNNHLHPFLAQSVVHLAGFYVCGRYIFSICRLRL